MMQSLHTKILDAARDEVARDYLCKDWQDFETRHRDNNKAKERAYFLAMEKQARFFLWLIFQIDSIDCEHGIIHGGGNFFKIERDEEGQPIMHPNKITELELYNIWREGKHD